MIRTQIYLSEEQRAHLASCAAREGENVSEIIRKAVESYLADHEREAQVQTQAQERIFDKAFGMWKDNKTDFAAIRKSADRFEY